MQATADVDKPVIWTKGEKRAFATLGIPYDHWFSPYTQPELEPEGDRCAWCDRPLKECEQGRRGACGFAVQA